MTNGCSELICNFEILDLQSFVSECVNEDETIKCDINRLLVYTNNKVLSKIWCNLSKDIRYNVGKMIITYLQNYVIGTVTQVCIGLDNCAGCNASWTQAVCLQNALIRQLKVNGKEPYGQNMNCYYKDNINGIEKCYNKGDDIWELPCYVTTISGDGFGHSICALQIDNDITKFDNWLFFQYNDNEINPGSWQMPYNTDIYVSIVTTMSCNGYSTTQSVHWHIDKNGNVT